jgi:ribonucleotide reductase alpha subunit
MKIAVLVTGEYRTFDHARKSMHFLDQPNIDVYFSTWDKISTSDKLSGYDFNKDKNYRIITKKIINRALNIPATVAIQDLVSSEKIKLSGPPLIKTWYLGFDLIRKSGKKYDYVLLTRPDLYFKHGKFNFEKLPDRTFQFTYDTWTDIQKASFIKGCYSANGGIIKKYRISYKTTSRPFADKLMQSLKNDFGIDSYLTTNKKTMVSFKNGDYMCKESYDINIGKFVDVVKFYEQIGFVHTYKNKDLMSLIKEKSPMVLGIKNIGDEKVYDFNEPISNWGIVEGFVVHNCGEQPLPKNFSCNLGSINLNEFVCNPYTSNASFNWADFDNTIRIGLNALDVIIDENANNHPLQEQKDNSINYRNVGLGVMG